MHEYLILALDGDETEIRFGDRALTQYAESKGCSVDLPYLRDGGGQPLFGVALAPDCIEETERMVAFARQLREQGWRSIRVNNDAIDLILAKAASLEHMVALANCAWLLASED